MATIGQLTRKGENFEGVLASLTIKAPIALKKVKKEHEAQPDYRMTSNNVEIGAGWIKKNKTTGNDYVSLKFEAPEFGRSALYANLGRMAGQDDDDVFAIIWNAAD